MRKSVRKRYLRKQQIETRKRPWTANTHNYKNIMSINIVLKQANDTYSYLFITLSLYSDVIVLLTYQVNTGTVKSHRGIVVNSN